MWKYSTLVIVIFLFGLFGQTNSQENIPNAEEVLHKVSNVIDLNSLNISTDTVFNHLNTSVMQATDEANNLFKQKCDKNGGDGAYENAQNAKNNLEQCLKSFVDIAKLEEEMEKYKPTGDLDIVFKSYCHKTPVLKKCVSDFTTAIEPCLEPAERKNKKIIQNVTDSLLNFVCYKEGDRIALFISADGPECIQSKQQEIQHCINATFGSYIPSINPNDGSLVGLNSFPILVLGAKECADISNLQNCVVKDLEKCSDPTPANIVDSIFKFILKVTPCQNLVAVQNVASISKISSLIFTSTAFLVLKFL